MRGVLQHFARDPGRAHPAIATLCPIAAALAGCAAFAPEVGRIDADTEPVTIVGYFRHYVLHSTYGEIGRVDADRLGGDTYAVKTAPGPHLVEMSMTQVSALNPLLFGGGRCALVLETVAGRTYRVQPPPMIVYGRFWLRPPGLHRNRFVSTIRIHASYRGHEDQNYEVPLDCESGALYCRVLADCTPPPSDDETWHPVACVYEDRFPVGSCSERDPAATD